MRPIAAAARAILCALVLVLSLPARAQQSTHLPPVLRVAIGTDVAPHSFADEFSGLQGIRRDMWEKWSQVTGVPVRFVMVPAKQAADTVEAGLADVADPVMAGSKGAAKLDLSRGFMENPVHIFFNADLPGIGNPESLRPFAVGVVEAGGCGKWLRARGVTNLRSYPNPEALVEGAIGHQIEVFCLGRYYALTNLAKSERLGQFRYGPQIFTGQLHWGVGKGNTALRDAIEAGFDRIPGEDMAGIVEDWMGTIPTSPWLPNLLKQAAWIGGGVALVIAMLAAWNWMLRRRVNQSVGELRAYAQRFETLVDNLPGMVTRAFQSEDGRFELLYVSRGGTRDGAAPVAPLDPMRLAELAASGKFKGRLRDRRPDGAIVWHDMWMTAVARRDGGIEYDTLALDVTSEVEARRALEQEERERQALEKQIHEASKFEALGKLAGGVAHDFNNLLGGILGFATLVAEDLGPDHPSQRFATRISAACLRGKNLVDQILAFARQTRSEPTRFPLNDLLAEFRPLLEVAIPSSIAIDTRAPDYPVEIQADRGQIGQVLMNLCFNARDAMENQTGTIVVAMDVVPPDAPLLHLTALEPAVSEMGWVTHAGEDGWGSVVAGHCDATVPYAVLSIRDSGTGMDQAQLDRIFEPFFTTKHQGKGTGLGLSVVHGIVISHRGAIQVRSRPGGGTEIKVLLPLAGAREDAAAGQTPVTAADEPAANGAGTRRRVLVVDDDGDFGDVLSLLLERRGWLASRYDDPRSALTALAASPGDWALLVTDQIMPNMLGQDLIAQAKSIRPDLPCLLCSGYDPGLDDGALARLRIDGLMQKPLEPKTLDAVIAAVVPS